ncbi:hypothetical protein HanIR_Chr15g0754551 [Helianthus annuus]|nr:hypothetical protein HanIR_Chr15g0754551 [Helianthus annuus]
MPRNAYRTLQCAYEDFRENCVTVNDNELMPYKILTTPTNTNYIRMLYRFEHDFTDLSCFQTSQNTNANEKYDCRNALATRRKHRMAVLT